MDPNRVFLRHVVATVAYRGGKAARGATADFAALRVCDRTRSAVQILAHIGDLLDWAVTLVQGNQAWKMATPQSWDAEVERFFTSLRRLDDCLADDTPLGCSAERLFQGPLADALTHIGQLATLRRLAGAPVAGENYFEADIVVGRVGSEQTPARFEFD
jgi:hypothetical protein